MAANDSSWFRSFIPLNNRSVLQNSVGGFSAFTPQTKPQQSPSESRPRHNFSSSPIWIIWSRVQFDWLGFARQKWTTPTGKTQAFSLLKTWWFCFRMRSIAHWLHAVQVTGHTVKPLDYEMWVCSFPQRCNWANFKNMNEVTHQLSTGQTCWLYKAMA